MEKKFEDFDLTREEIIAINKDPKLVKVGMGGSYHIGSDSYGFEVIAILDDKHIMCRDLDSRQVGDYFGNQKWEHYSNDQREEFKLFFKDGNWRKQVGRKLNRSGYYSIGKASSHRDPSF